MDGEDYRDMFSRASADARRQRDFDDLQNETSGLDAGRMKRFLHGARDPATLEKERKAREKTMLSALDALLLSDPEYAKLYEETWAQMVRAEKLADEILGKAEMRLVEILDSATRLEDGRAVFKDEKGQLRTEDGKLIDPALAEGLAFPEDAPSYEDYRATRERIDKVRTYQVEVLGSAREVLSDREHPATKEELEDLKKRLHEASDDLSQQVDSAAPEQDTATRNTSELAFPTLGG